MTLSQTRLAILDSGQINERILNRKDYRADFRRVEGASLKRKTQLSSPEAKRMFARCFYSLQASMYFISYLGRTRLDHEAIETIEKDVLAALEKSTNEIDRAIDQAEALLKAHNIEGLASYDTVPLVEEIAITSAFGRRYFELIHKLDVLMPLMDTLLIEEVISTGEHGKRRSRYKRAIVRVSTKARLFWVGVRKRMNEAEQTSDKGNGAPASARAPASEASPQSNGADSLQEMAQEADVEALAAEVLAPAGEGETAGPRLEPIEDLEPSPYAAGLQ